MLSNHGKQYKNKIEAMSNRKIEELNNDLLDLSTNTFDIINKVKNLIDVPVNKMALYNQRNTMSNNDDDIYTGNVFKDMCGNYFRVNNKGVIKQYDNPSNYVIDTLYTKNNINANEFLNKNFTDLNTYDEFIVDDSYNFIKGTNIGTQGITGKTHTGKYVFSNTLINDKYDMNGSENIIGDCYTLKSGQTFSSEATYSNISSPFECKQLAIDNFYKHYILQQDADGSLNCYLSNNDNILNYYDVSASACELNSGFKKGLNINNSYGIYNNKQIGSKDNYREGGYVDFDSNFVRKNQDLSIDNSNTYTIEKRKFASMESDISCNILQSDETIIGYVQNNIDNKCYSVSNDILMDPKQRIYDANYDIIMKNKKYDETKEGFVTKQINSNKLSKYTEVDIPTFTVKDILTEDSDQGGYLQAYPLVRDEIISETNTITENNQKIYQELEKYNRILRQANLELSSDISLNMNYVNNIEDYLNPEKDYALNNQTNLEYIQELKRKLEDEKLVLGFNHNNYILWTLLGVATLVVLLKVSKPSNN
jgi:hypothetical protein